MEVIEKKKHWHKYVGLTLVTLIQYLRGIICFIHEQQKIFEKRHTAWESCKQRLGLLEPTRPSVLSPLLA